MPLIVHIGYHKTGSTALQSWLNANRELLRGRAVVYPPGLSSWRGHPEICWAFAGNRYPWQDRAYDLTEVKNHYAPYLEMAQQEDVIVIFSSEELCRLDFEFDVIQNLKNWLVPANPIICGYLRDPLSFLMSRYRHEVQEGGEQRPLREFLTNIDNILSANFHSRALVWEQCFDRRCIFRHYNKSVIEEGIVCAFLRLLSIEASSIEGALMASDQYRDVEKKIHLSLIESVRQSKMEFASPDERARVLDLLFEASDFLPEMSLRDFVDSIGLSQDMSQLLGSLRFDTINQQRTLEMLTSNP